MAIGQSGYPDMCLKSQCLLFACLFVAFFSGRAILAQPDVVDIASKDLRAAAGRLVESNSVAV